MSTLPAALTLLVEIDALVWVRMTFVAAAPAPLIAAPSVPPAIATDAPTAIAVIADLLVADDGHVARARCHRSLTPVIDASTRLSMSLRPIDTAIERATPTRPAKPAATRGADADREDAASCRSR